MEQSFLQLLVAQFRYQDPLSPQDGTQFVSQLLSDEFAGARTTCAATWTASSIMTQAVREPSQPLRPNQRPIRPKRPPRIPKEIHVYLFFYCSFGPGGGSTAIDVAGNNLANLNTAGFKASEVSFHDLVTQSLGAGLGDTQVGFGVGTPITQRAVHAGRDSNHRRPARCRHSGRRFLRGPGATTVRPSTRAAGISRWTRTAICHRDRANKCRAGRSERRARIPMRLRQHHRPDRHGAAAVHHQEHFVRSQSERGGDSRARRRHILPPRSRSTIRWAIRTS